MPFVRKGKTVYKKLPGGGLKKRGTSKTVAKAKAYKRTLGWKSAGR